MLNAVFLDYASLHATHAVAQHTFALIPAQSHLRKYRRAAINGNWSACPRFCRTHYPIRDLAGGTLGIIGYGDLGQAVARLGQAFALRVLIAEGEAGPAPDRCEPQTPLT